MSSGSRWYPTASQLKTPESLERSVRQVLKQQYALVDRVGQIETTQTAQAGASANGSSSSASGPATTQILGLNIAPVDTASLPDGNVLTYVKSAGNFQFLPVGGGASGVTSLNGLTGVITITGGTDISVAVSGSSIVVSFTGSIPTVPTFNDDVTPTGTIDGSNATFTISPAPSPAASLQLFLNGVLQYRGTDYTLTGGTIVYTTPPTVGSVHACWYRS